MHVFLYHELTKKKKFKLVIIQKNEFITFHTYTEKNLRFTQMFINTLSNKKAIININERTLKICIYIQRGKKMSFGCLKCFNRAQLVLIIIFFN